jgi:hypothetical protein
MSTNQRTLRPSICFHERNDAVVLAIWRISISTVI